MPDPAPFPAALLAFGVSPQPPFPHRGKGDHAGHPGIGNGSTNSLISPRTRSITCSSPPSATAYDVVHPCGDLGHVILDEPSGGDGGGAQADAGRIEGLRVSNGTEL